MKIKKYLGATANEAMLELKRELGPDAVVLNTKHVRAKGIFKYFKKPLVEVTAAYEEDNLNSNKINKYDDKLNNVNDELTELKKLMYDMPNEIQKQEKLPKVLEIYKKRMIQNGIDEEIVHNILEEISDGINLKDKDVATVENIIKYNLMEYLGNPQPITMDNNRKIIFFVGPTGVGKTTTLAKIAASLVMENKYKIGLITSDTYRIGAVDQLKIYSDILELPLEISYNQEDMHRAFHKFENKDIILVDTAGRNHNDLEQLKELEDVLKSTETKEIYLILSATIDRKVLEGIIEKYSVLGDLKIIITKIDEAEDYGSIFNIRHISNKELSYYTTGQGVPDDIRIIDKEDIVKKLIKENNDNGSS